MTRNVAACHLVTKYCGMPAAVVGIMHYGGLVVSPVLWLVTADRVQCMPVQ
jgi:hypothetical protein